MKNMSTERQTGYPSIDKPWLKYYTKEQINASLPEYKIYDYIFSCFNLSLDEYFVYVKTLNKKIKLSELSEKDFDAKDSAYRLQKKGLIYILNDVLYNPNNCILDGIKIVLKEN